MKTRTLVILTVLMIFSLGALIWIQSYWIRTTLNERKSIFEQDVDLALKSAALKIEERELENFFTRFTNLRDFVKLNRNIAELNYQKINRDDNEALSFSHRTIENKMTVPMNLVSNEAKDSVRISTFFDYTKILQEPISSGGSSPSFAINYTPGEGSGLSAVRTSVERIGDLTPINQRINNSTLRAIVRQELLKRNIDTEFDATILNEESLNDMLSTEFDKSKEYFSTEIFESEAARSDSYELVAAFPKQKIFIASAILPMMLASFLFIMFITLFFTLTLKYTFRQKRLADMKNDFINNITHEFKTPIATIGIAADAIRTKNIICDESRVNHYIGIIKEENGKMFRQVENVLRIARLERHSLLMDKQDEELGELLREALERMELMVENRGGTVQLFLTPEKAYIKADSLHLINSFLNILENAVKYSGEKPEIKVKSWMKGKSWYVLVSDKGVGISPADQKRIFENFYRAEAGNIHNIKGHGLGLAYAYKIIGLHGGNISVKSSLGKGSDFTIEIPVNQLL